MKTSRILGWSAASICYVLSWASATAGLIIGSSVGRAADGFSQIALYLGYPVLQLLCMTSWIVLLLIGSGIVFMMSSQKNIQ